MTTTLVAVGAVPHDPPPPATMGCAYQVEIEYHTYQCLTAQQWADQKARELQEQARATASLDRWWTEHGLQAGVIVGGLLLLIIVSRIVYVVRHPKDQWGIRS